MKSSLRISVLLAVSLGAADAAWSQIPLMPFRGTSSALPSVLSFSNPCGTFDSVWVVNYKTGLTTPAEAFIPGPNVPNYSLDARFGALSGLVQIDGQSTGNARLPAVDPDGVPEFLPTAQWGTITISLENNTGATPGSVVPAGAPDSVFRRRSDIAVPGVRNTVGADLVSHFFAGSVGVPLSLSNGPFYSQTAEDLGLGAGNLTEFDSLDFAMGLAAVRQPVGNADLELYSRTTRVFFSLTPCSAAAIAAAGATGVFGSEPLGPGYIYEQHWLNGTNWGPVTVYRTPADLGLGPTDDVDALDVDAEAQLENSPGVMVPIVGFNPAFDKVIFSTQPAQGRSQILVHADLGSNGVMQTVPLTERRLVQGTSTAVPVTQAYGVRDGAAPVAEHDNVRTVCIEDPKFEYLPNYRGAPTGDITDLVPGLAFPDDPFPMSITRYVPRQVYRDLSDNGVLAHIPALDRMNTAIEIVGFIGRPNNILSSEIVLRVINPTATPADGDFIPVLLELPLLGGAVPITLYARYVDRQGQYVARTYFMSMDL